MLFEQIVSNFILVLFHGQIWDKKKENLYPYPFLDILQIITADRAQSIADELIWMCWLTEYQKEF